MPWKIVERDGQFCIYKHDENGDPVGDSLGCHPNMAAATEQMKALHASEPMMSEMIYAHVSELRGGFPDIALPADVDLEALGADPVFVTLPVMPAGTTSGNGRKYSKNFASAIVREINNKRPEGRFGHLREDERATRYDPPAVRWIIAQQDEKGMAWAKGIALTTAARDYFRQAKATRGRVATSIYGWASEANGEAVDIDLETLDIADPARAGIREAVALPHVTQEMQDETPGAVGTETLPDTGAVSEGGGGENPPEKPNNPIQETSNMEDLDKLVSELRSERDTAQTELANKSKLVAELSELVPGADLVVGVKAMIAEMTTLRTKVLMAEIQQVIEQEVKLKDLRPIIAEMLGPVDSKEKAQARVRELLQSEHIQRLAKALVLEMGGPHVLATAQRAAAKFEDTPEKRAAARAEFGF